VGTQNIDSRPPVSFDDQDAGIPGGP